MQQAQEILKKELSVHVVVVVVVVVVVCFSVKLTLSSRIRGLRKIVNIAVF